MSSCKNKLFQSTPPRGWRLYVCCVWRSGLCISIHSTTRVETETYICFLRRRTISIHSTTRVETDGMDLSEFLQIISIHSTTRVETHVQHPGPLAQGISIHSTTRVETQAIPIAPAFKEISIHSTTRVETVGRWRFRQGLVISIHSTTRVETRSAVNKPVEAVFQSTPPRGWRQQYYTITTTILQHISTNKSYPTPSNHGQPSLHTRKSVLIVQIFRCESPRKSMFASGSHQNTLYRFTARGQVRISAVLPH